MEQLVEGDAAAAGDLRALREILVSATCDDPAPALHKALADLDELLAAAALMRASPA